ncbi:hypothetical protein E2C01_001623 [Portunus trituberculatus]|uniref:Uncharacterized protein n=1 Tax=Portunus trituberculatus TaxID=210409 RepID=A0A5B7CJR1_PORTR|nr:hypothetical protein [Portunus trituberculatus]
MDGWAIVGGSVPSGGAPSFTARITMRVEKCCDLSVVINLAVIRSVTITSVVGKSVVSPNDHWRRLALTSPSALGGLW